ncbi:MAG: hypothetical protein WB992_03105 [Bryobacteraceae bacterium]
MTIPEKSARKDSTCLASGSGKRCGGAEHISLDDMSRQAVERYIEDHAGKRSTSSGEQQDRNLGIKQRDVDRIIDQRRSK